MCPLFAVLVAACDPGREELSRSGSALNTDNGVVLNGRTLNGRTLNGNDLSGLLTGVRLDSIKLAGHHATLSSVTLQASRFSGTNGTTTYEGTAFVGASLTGTLGDGNLIPLRIDAISNGQGPNGDLLMYSFSYRDPGTGTWNPGCVDALNNPVPAIPVMGRWDYRTGVAGGGAFIDDPSAFTFACTSGAVGKCVVDGYRPWASVSGKSLAPYHQACTRLLRADYCGDGTSYTQNGRSVNLYDSLGIQIDTAPWLVEAAWSPSGAVCFRNHNRALTPVPCYQQSYESACGSSYPGNSVLMSEIQ
ncbi:MAG TPA: ADYC domain-containing protein [Longimicrobium sp.]|nr:ADYC domain-containing protein [Longimicrobium sp.]